MLDIRQMLDYIGVQAEPLNIAPSRVPPLWEGCDAPVGEGIESEPDWDLAGQPAPDYEVDQRINWRLGEAAIQTRYGRAACAPSQKPFGKPECQPSQRFLNQPGYILPTFTLPTFAILGLIWLNFLSVSGWHIAICHSQSHATLCRRQYFDAT
jgi:hypothetical protein